MTMLNTLIQKITNAVQEEDFVSASKTLHNFIFALSKDDFMKVVIDIGIIPESIEHDSSTEKLFSKVSDSVLARCFCEIGLNATVLTERADSADVIASSNYHNYDLVADAKAFRLSRTAKNQKDFKVVALSNWRQDSNFAVLVAPYFQYPNTTSQIYSQAITHNVCLLTWEHLIFLMKNNIKENENLNLSLFWHFSESYSHQCLASDTKKYFINKFDVLFLLESGKNSTDWQQFLNHQIKNIQERGVLEIDFWQNEIQIIQNYTKEQAILELIKCKKIDSKIKQIKKYTQGLSYGC